MGRALPAEQARIVQILVERIEVRIDVDVHLRANGLAREVAGDESRSAAA